MENEMMYVPFMWVIILGTGILSAVVTQALPMVPKWWSALKNATKRRKTQKPKRNKGMDMVDVILISKLTERIDELEEQMDNVAKNSYRREQNRKNNIRREVRDYLKELQKK